MRQPGEGIFGDFSMCLDNFWFPVIQRETHPEKKNSTPGNQAKSTPIGKAWAAGDVFF